VASTERIDARQRDKVALEAWKQPSKHVYARDQTQPYVWGDASHDTCASSLRIGHSFHDALHTQKISDVVSWARREDQEGDLKF
jgi:hypothetical protein